MALAAISSGLNRILLHSTSFFGSTLSRTARLNLHDLIRGPFIRGFSTFTSRGDTILYQGYHKGELGDVVQNKGRPNLVVSSDFVTKKLGIFC